MTAFDPQPQPPALRRGALLLAEALTAHRLITERVPATYTFTEGVRRPNAEAQEPLAAKPSRSDRRTARMLQLSRAQRSGAGYEEAVKVIALGEYDLPSKIERTFGVTAETIERIRGEYADKAPIIVEEAVRVRLDGSPTRTTTILRERVRLPERVGLDPLRRSSTGLTSREQGLRSRFARYDDPAHDSPEGVATYLALDGAFGETVEGTKNRGISMRVGIRSAVDFRQQDATSPDITPHQPATERDGDGWSAWDAENWLAQNDYEHEKRATADDVAPFIEQAFEDHEIREEVLRDAVVRGNLSLPRRNARTEARSRLHDALSGLWNGGHSQTAMAKYLGMDRGTLRRLMAE